MTFSRLHGSMLVLAVLFIIGCNTGNGSGKTQKTGTGGTGPTTSTTTTTVQVPIAGVANPTTATLGGVLHSLIFTATPPAGQTVVLTTVRVTASGTANDAATFTRLTLVRDNNGNGQVDAQDTAVANATPAFAADNGTTTLTGANTLTGATQFIVTLETVLPVTPTVASEITVIGQTVTLAIPSASDVVFTSGTQSVTTTGTFPVAGQAVRLGLGDHLLITEIHDGGVGPGAANADYIEIFNPTATPIDMSNYHLTDASVGNAPGTREYFRLSTSTNFGPPGGNPPPAGDEDFSVRFPNAFIIQPGQFVVIAVDGQGFATAFPAPATPVPVLSLRRPQTGSTSMRVWDNAIGTNGPVFNTNPVPDTVDLVGAGEQVWLFMWNGGAAPVPDLVSDVDIVGWGPAQLITNANHFYDKSGVTVNGPNPLTAGTAYRTETAFGTQEGNRALTAGLTAGQSIARVSYLEGNEAKTNGNGITTHNETSEVYNQTWGTAAAAASTPGRFQ